MFWKNNDVQFGKILNDHIANSLQASYELTELFSAGSLDEMRLERIMELEHIGDALVREYHEVLDRTFIAKLDKPDITLLIQELDHVIDYIKATAWRLRIYHIERFRPEGKIFADIIRRMIEVLQVLIGDLYHLKNADVQKQVVALKEAEEEADHLLYHALEKLFLEEHDWKIVMQWRDIFQQLENVTDHCEDVADTISSIARKEAN